MILPLLLLACGDLPPDDSDVIDLRLDAEDIPGADPDDLWYGPELTIQPGEDIMWCLVGTYTGEDVGITAVETWQAELGHHFVILGTTEPAVDIPDGTLFDCTGSDDLSMENLEPIVLPTAANSAAEPFEVPDGMATKLRSGQRWVLQSHYINSSPDPVLVRDIAEVRTVPIESVETWAAPIVFNRQSFEVPAQSGGEVTFDCTFDEDYDLLYLLGHMHEWGRAFSIEVDTGEGFTPVYTIDDWDASYRDAPPTERYEEGAFHLAAGDVVRTHCEWYNDTDVPLVFPHEMCVAVGFAYPALTSVVCSD